MLPRLQWLAPYRSEAAELVLDRARLQAALALQFDVLPMPVLVASVKEVEGVLVETGRGFIVPNDWRARAALRRKVMHTA